MHEAGVTRLVLVSSLSVLRPPRTPWERQDEHTPRPDDPERFGPYVWGKSRQEELVEREAPALGIAVRIVRPGALVDWSEPELPGVMGRQLFGPWHLGLGRSRLPIAVCDVARCAEAIAWCATHFDDAPPLVNLFEPALTTRGAFLARLREDGWTGRIVWVPISTISCAIVDGACASVAAPRAAADEARGVVDSPSPALRQPDGDEGAGRMPMTVFVTDGNQRSALAIVRALGRRGATVIVGDEQPVSLASASRHCARRITYPSPYTNRAAFERFLLDFVAREHVDVLLPVTDVTTHSVCALQDRLAAHTALAVPPFDAFEIVTHKGRLVEYAASLGVPIPRTHCVDGLESLDRVVDRVEYPAVVKPVRSRLRTGRWLGAGPGALRVQPPRASDALSRSSVSRVASVADSAEDRRRPASACSSCSIAGSSSPTSLTAAFARSRPLAG